MNIYMSIYMQMSGVDMYMKIINELGG